MICKQASRDGGKVSSARGEDLDRQMLRKLRRKLRHKMKPVSEGHTPGGGSWKRQKNSGVIWHVPDVIQQSTQSNGLRQDLRHTKMVGYGVI